MFRTNCYGKIVVNQTEVYYGCIVAFDDLTQLAKLYVVDWRDKDFQPKRFKEMTAHASKFTIKYDGGLQ